MVAEGIARGFATFSGEALRELVHAELGPEDGARVARGFPVTSVVLAGAIPMPTALALIAPLALRSPVLARPSARDPISARVVAEALRALDPPLGEALEIVSFPSCGRGSSFCSWRWRRPQSFRRTPTRP